MTEEVDRPGRADGAQADLRWVLERLDELGPEGVIQGLIVVAAENQAPAWGSVSGGRAERLAGVLRRHAHALEPTDPPQALPSLLLNRLAVEPEWAESARNLQEALSGSRFRYAWRPPVEADPALIATLRGHVGPVLAVCASADGSWLATAGSDHTVRLWDAGTFRLRAVLEGHQGPVTAVAAAADGSWIASGSTDRSVRIWDATTFQVRTTLPGHRRPITALAAAPDGTWIATGSTGDEVRVHDTRSGRTRAVLRGQKGPVTALAVTEDGSRLLAGGHRQVLSAWTFDGHEFTATALPHQKSVVDRTTLAISADGRQFATAFDYTGPGTGCPGAATTEYFPQEAWAGNYMDGSVRDTTAMAFSPDGSLFAAAGDTGICWYDGLFVDERRPGNRYLSSGRQYAPFTAVAFSPDGAWLAGCPSDGTVRIWAMSGLVHRPEQKASAAHQPDTALPIAVSPDHRWVLTLSARTAYRGQPDDRGRAEIWDAAERSVVGVVSDVWLEPRLSASIRAEMGAQGDWAIALDRAPVRLWAESPTKGESEPSARWHDVAYRGSHVWERTSISRTVLDPWAVLAASPEGSWVAIAGTHGAHLILRSSITGMGGPHGLPGSQLPDPDERRWTARLPRRRAKREPGRRLAAGAAGPDGSWLAVGGESGAVLLWDMRPVQAGRHVDAYDLQPPRLLRRHTGPVAALQAGPDGTWLASGGQDRRVLIWEMPAGTVLCELLGHETGVCVLAPHPAGRLLLSGGRENHAQIWDVSTGVRTRTLNWTGGLLTAAAFSPDGRWLATGCEDGTIRLWSALEWHSVTMMRIDDEVLRITWDPASRQIAASDRHGVHLLTYVT
ncbi:hypothetical protein Kisp01_39460 [Kineosporia sp. NBRC 101677]|uniref:WD40 repeat domain-containing protein n=1 Tax=Kineosporia sp. NBRC 101677 TaxID=3032197 RepID=UPI0024A5A8C6|nr:WD40 repeat domain-containing protein [Kineosporia sp. NBRC 101677]GLY16931.1 hypothetical protein Kisp01_39460 [Kineosporia sp. NBRC 101677]